MAKYVLNFKRLAVKDISKLPIPVRRRLKQKLIWWSEQPNPLHFSLRMTKREDARYRYRIGSYRILFDIEDNKIVILRIQHRRDVYRRR